MQSVYTIFSSSFKRSSDLFYLSKQIDQKDLSTYCSWKSSIGGSNRRGRQFPRYRDTLQEK